ncbi:MAG: outer membrane protein assembly factor BamA [Elusimicrobiales bacterium]|jgi:outer membrane protein insertion porin family
MKKNFLLPFLICCLNSFAAGQNNPVPSAPAPYTGAPVSTEAFKISEPAAASSVPVSTGIAGLPGIADAAAQAPRQEKTGQGPWEVGAVAVRGAVNVKPKVVLKTGKAKKGKLYYQDFVNADIEAILGLGSMEKVSVDIADIKDAPVDAKFRELTGSSCTVSVTYIVSEKFMLKTVTIAGAKELSKGTVKDEMSLKEKDFFDELKIREDLIKITDKYHEKGYIEAKADYEVRYDTAARTAALTVSVIEGKKAKIAEVALEGVKGFKTAKLVKKMKNRPKRIYLPQDLENDFKGIETFYKNNGYSDFKLESSSVTFSEDKSKVFIKAAISEGALRHFGVTLFSGNTVYPSKELLELLEYRRGKLFNQEKFDDSIKALQDKYADKGYLKAMIKPEKVLNPATGGLDITFKITENNPIYVGNIDVEGNKATKTFVLKREIVQKEGAVFSSSKIRRSQEKLFNLGFLDDVGIVINPTPDPDKVDLVFDVAEGKPGMLTAGAGISSRDGLVGTLSLQHLNLLGRAYRTSLSWNFGKKVQDYTLSWSTPWIGNHPTTLGLDIFNTRHFMPFRSTLSAYTEKRTGGKVTLGPRFEDDKYHLTTSYTYEKVRISGVDAAFTTELPEGTSVTSSIYVEFARDTRDNVWDPTRGSKASIGVDLTGGPLMGAVNYYKPNVTYTHNLKLFSIDDYPFVFAISNKAGYGAGFGKTPKLPVYERYFLGGADTIRGYNNNGQIGPLDGGKVYDILNLEFHFPLAREKKRTIVQWAFFLDVGNSWDRFNNVSMRSGTGVNDLKVGAGFGIRFTTPAFPIRLDWGYGFNHKPGEQLSDIYFTLGNLF